MEFQIPSRGIIGLRSSNVLTASGGEAIMAHRFLEYQPWKGDIERRTNGSLIAIEVRHGICLCHRQVAGPRTLLYLPAGRGVRRAGGRRERQGQRHTRQCDQEQEAYQYASFGAPTTKARIVPPVVFSLEEALEYIKEDEYVEVTPTISVCAR